jgi:tetratricopeptide (TPR) repeat protein
LIFLILPVSIFAVDTGSDELSRITEIAFANTESESVIFAAIDDAIEQAAKIATPSSNIIQADLYLLRARMLLGKSRNSDADKYLALAEAKMASIGEKDSPDAIALLVEIRTSMFATRGLGYIIGNSGAIEKLLSKALEKDPQNARAIILQANSELYKPFGNIDASITLFSKALGLSSISKQRRFTALLGLAEAWNKKSNSEKRKSYLNMAKELYPGNPALLEAIKKAGLQV